MAKSEMKLLGSVALFEGLSQKELAQIRRQAREVEFSAGKTIVKQGDKGVGFHLILSGKAKVVVNGRARGTLKTGDFFGELSLIDRGMRTASVIAETPVKALTIVSWDFIPLLEQSPSIARKILVEMCRRLREADRSHTH